jgi:GTP-binding protein
VAFVGRSNVGKSSLLNRVLGRKGLARTSSTPGRTRLANFFAVNGRVVFVDLPGYGYAKASRDERRAWGELADRYLRQAGAKALVVHLIDGKVGATELDREASRYLEGLGLRRVVVATKMDRLPRGRWRAALEAVRRGLGTQDEAPVIAFSARTGDGVKELWRDIASHVEGTTGALG